MDRVEPLRKVSVSIRAAEDPPQAGSALATFELAFICGIGRSGVTPFESQLAGRRVGDNIDLRIMAPQAESFFEHLAPRLCTAFAGREAVRLNVKITAIDTPEARDLVKAMAERSSHGGAGCDCGCGCGCG